MDFHEVANIYPMLPEDEFKKLVEAIKARGLREPIVLYQGKIVDGRNRYNACLELEIEPRFVQWNEQGSLLDFVRDLNYNRRQLSTSQRAMVAARMKPLYEEEARERQKLLAGTRPNTNPESHGSQGNETGRTNEIVGDMMGVSAGSVKRASKVLKDGTPELIEAVDSGKVSVRSGAEIAKMPKEIQQVAIEEAKAPKKADVAKENVEYIQEHTVELTEEDREIQKKIDEINEYMRINIGELNYGYLKKVCE